MSTVKVSTQINASIQRVWDTVMDPSRLGDWVTIHRGVSEVSSRPLARGSTMNQLLNLRGVNFHVHWTLADVTPPRHAEWDGKGPAHSHAIIRYDLQDEGGGVTRFEYTNEFQAPGGVLGTMASRVIVGGVSEREAHNSLSRLKTLVESSP
jgi:uncharacterized protein YndB with AHSA1/START domain